MKTKNKMNNNSIYSRIFNKNTSLNDNKEVINLKENKNIIENIIENKNKKNNIDLIDNYNDKSTILIQIILFYH